MQADCKLKAHSSSLEQVADILTDANILETVNAGSIVIHHVWHPTLGKLVVVNSACGANVVVPV